MRFEEVYPAIPRFFPFFSERVCILFRRLLQKLGEGPAGYRRGNEEAGVRGG
jgi:hypothetical protein